LEGGDIFTTKQQGNCVRSFHEKYYFKEISLGSYVKRNWLSYSPSTDCVFCIVCKLFGLPNGKHDQFSKLGTNDWKHISYNIKVHESAPEHLLSEIRRVMYTSQLRVDVQLLSPSNSQVVENRETVKIIFEALLYLVWLNNAFRGFSEHWGSSNQGNFVEIVKLLVKYNPLLSAHLSKIQNAKKKQINIFIKC
jgi:hypothetical protein